MANDPKKPLPGELTVDASDLKPFLKDLPEGATVGMLTEQEGFTEVVTEALTNQTEWGDKAGITTSDINDFQAANERVAQIDEVLPAARKLVEILEESRAKYDDQRQRAVHAMASAVEARAKVRDDGATLLAKYQKTRVYRSAIALKAVKTRRKNASEQAAAAAAAAAAATPKVPATP